jgi:hypothetical protein
MKTFPSRILLIDASTARAAVERVPHACHQKFDSLEKANAASKIWRDTADAVGYKPPEGKHSRRSGSSGRKSYSSKQSPDGDVQSSRTDYNTSDLSELMKDTHLDDRVNVKKEQI